MNTRDPIRERDLDALLDGSLPPAAAQRLRRQLDEESRRLQRESMARARHSGAEMPRVVPAPAALRARLRAIPGRGHASSVNLLRWGLPATLAVLVLSLSIGYHRQPPPDIPTQAELDQARADLTVAFSYLEQIGSRTDRYMRRTIGTTMEDALVEGIFIGVANKTRGG